MCTSCKVQINGKGGQFSVAEGGQFYIAANTSLDDQRIKKAIADVKARCRRCPSEGLCERWLLGKVDGENTFCPNALTFDRLMQTAKSAA